MIGTLYRFLLLPALVGAAAYLCWERVPSSPVDRAAFRAVAGSYANPPFFISGDGTHASPWGLRTMTRNTRPEENLAAACVTIGDDPDGIFQSSPPSAIDLTVILRNLEKIGVKQIAIPYVLAWDEPDAISLVALEHALGRFDVMISGTPLSRAAVAEPLPQAFRRASLAVEEVRGDVSALPQVNRVPVPGLIYGGEDSLAGFTLLESETGAPGMHLVARWGDRLVFSLPLLTAAARHGVAPEEIVVCPGDHIRLGDSGPVLFIDAFGRLARPPEDFAPAADVRAIDLIDPDASLLPDGVVPPVVLRDGLSAADPATREFSRMLPGLVAALSSDRALSTAREYPRLPVPVEWSLLGAFTFLLSAVAVGGRFRRLVCFSLLAGLALAAQWIGAGMAAVWLPGVPALAAVLTAAILSPGPRRVKTKAVEPEAEAANEPSSGNGSPP